VLSGANVTLKVATEAVEFYEVVTLRELLRTVQETIRVLRFSLFSLPSPYVSMGGAGFQET